MGIELVGRNLVVVVVGAALLGGCAGGREATSVASSAPAGNGVAELAPAVIVERAQAALKGAASYRYKAAAVRGGVRTVDEFEVSGADLVGTSANGKTTVRFLRIGGQQYMKPDAAFWGLTRGARAGAVIRMVGDRWVRVPAGDKTYGRMFPTGNIKVLLDLVGMINGDTATKGPAETIGGTPAISLLGHGVVGDRLYVATEGPPYPLRVDDPKNPGTGFTLSDFGVDFADLKPPAVADVLDLAALGV